MSEIGNSGDLNDFINQRDSWLGSQAKSHYRVRVFFFQGYEVTGNQANPNETFRKPIFAGRLDHVWLSFIKVYDTVKMGYFTTGDVQVESEFPMKGFSASYTLTSGEVIPEYAGDIMQWLGKFWEVSDVLEPLQTGYQFGQTWYRTVMRRTNRSGVGVEVGP